MTTSRFSEFRGARVRTEWKRTFLWRNTVAEKREGTELADIYKFMWERWKSEMGNDGGEKYCLSGNKVSSKVLPMFVQARSGKSVLHSCRCGGSLLAKVHAPQFVFSSSLWNFKHRARPRGQLRITVYHVKKYKMNYRPWGGVLPVEELCFQYVGWC